MTPRQKQLLDFLRARVGDDIQPSLAEMAEHLGTPTRSAVHRLLLMLETEGLVKKTGGGARCWRAVPPDPFAGMTDEALAAELRRRGYTLEAHKTLPRNPDSGWAGSPVKRL